MIMMYNGILLLVEASSCYLNVNNTQNNNNHLLTFESYIVNFHFFLLLIYSYLLK